MKEHKDKNTPKSEALSMSPYANARASLKSYLESGKVIPATLVLFEVVQLPTWLISAPSGVIYTPNEFIMHLTLSMLSYKSRLNYKWLAQT